MQNPTNIILGISAYYHDSAASLIINDKIIAAAQEERFTRIKNDPAFPKNAISYVLNEAGIQTTDITDIAFYDKPFLKFERLLETYHNFAPFGFKSFLSAIPIWIKEKLFMKNLLKKELNKIGKFNAPIYFPEHHLSHIASAFYPSPFKESAILTIDGVGEWAVSTISYGNSENIKILKEMHFPHSIGLLYSSFTYYLGFKVNNGEYKVMGLAPYGNLQEANILKEKILTNIVDLKDDGSIFLNMDYFNFATGLTMTKDKKWKELFQISRRLPESEMLNEHTNLALAIQLLSEEIFLRLAKTTQKLTNSKNLVLAGGVALNSVANGKLLKEKIFENIWIQPASGDSGGSLGAALSVLYIAKNEKRKVNKNEDSMMGAYLGPSFSNLQIENLLIKHNAKYTHYENFDELIEITSKKIAEGKVIGWFQDRMEFGPRALGNRSILGDARNPEMQKIINFKIKKREGFRPFAPSVLEEDCQKYFNIDIASPYMLFVIPILDSLKNEEPANYQEWNMYDKLYYIRSQFPAITHIDYSARIQTVNKQTNPKYHKLLKSFKKLTNESIIINTSFNVRGEPIVCNPNDAYNCFIKTNMDYLVMENFFIEKEKKDD